MPLARLKEFSPAFGADFAAALTSRPRSPAARFPAALRRKRCVPRSTISRRASPRSRKIDEAAPAMNPNLSASNVPRGFKYAATHCGLKKTRLDLGILVSDDARSGRGRLYDEPGGRRSGRRIARAPPQIARLGARHHREFGQRELLHARRRLSGVDRDGAEACRGTGRRRSRADSRLLHRRDRRAAASRPNPRRGAGARPRAQLAGRPHSRISRAPS